MENYGLGKPRQLLTLIRVEVPIGHINVRYYA